MKRCFYFFLLLILGCSSGSSHYKTESKADILKFLVPQSVRQESSAKSKAGISEGMSKSEVRRLMGTPQKAARYGSDERWSYVTTSAEDRIETMDVYFQDGKVTDWRR